MHATGKRLRQGLYPRPQRPLITLSSLPWAVKVANA